MTPKERQEVDRIVEQMKDEKDQAKFAELLRQFNEIINRKQLRLEKPPRSNQKSSEPSA